MARVQDKDFCEMTSLQELDLESNMLTEDNIHRDSLRCLTALRVLYVCLHLPVLSLHVVRSRRSRYSCANDAVCGIWIQQ